MPRQQALQDVTRKDLIALLEKGGTLRSIADHYDTSHIAVKNKIEREGIKFDHKTGMYLSPAPFEISTELVDKYYQDPPIDVRLIAEKEGFKIKETEDFDDDLSGMLANKTIYIRKNMNEARKRFTISHELAHGILHRKDHKFKGLRFQGQYTTEEQKQEREANLFASNLLMTKKFLIRDVKRNEDELNEELISSLAKRYNVSLQAMMIRLNVLGYT
ncbi:ImmA/IrrE family metallo-endopeptidase [bacterium]|nr:ImmA/IrrE family metallo-endopeptidase [bacterium]